MRDKSVALRGGGVCGRSWRVPLRAPKCEPYSESSEVKKLTTQLQIERKDIGEAASQFRECKRSLDETSSVYRMHLKEIVSLRAQLQERDEKLSTFMRDIPVIRTWNARKVSGNLTEAVK